MKTSKAIKAIRETSLETKVVAVILAVALILMQTSIVWATNPSTTSDESDAAATQGSSATVELDFDHSYIVYDGQTVAPPASKVDAPLDRDFIFVPYADSDYELDKVVVTADGEETVLSSYSSGKYTIPGYMMTDTVSLSIQTEDMVVEAEEATEPADAEKAAEEATDADDSDAKATDAKDTTASTDFGKKAAASDDPTKSKYSYKDSNVEVTATLTDVAAVPDDAVLTVTPVTSSTEGYNYNAYMDALNNGITDEAAKYTDENALLYDVAFMVQKTDESGAAINGEYVEYEPAAGSVKLNFKFRDRQLSSALEANDASDVVVKHLPLSDEVRNSTDSTQAATNISKDDVTVEDVDAKVTLGADTAKFSVSDLSVFVFKNNTTQTNTWTGNTTFSIGSILSALGDVTQFAAYANKFINGTHLEGNIKVGVLDAISQDAVLNQDANVIERTAVDRITVTKTVSEGASGTFKMAAYAADDVAKGKELYTFEIAVPEGQTSASYELNSANAADAIGALSSKSVVIYELDANGDIVAEGGTLDNKYTVSYTDNTVEPSKSINHFTNYIGSITNSKSTDGSVWLNQNYFDSQTLGSHTYIESYDDAKWDGTHWTFKSTSNGDTKTVYVKDYNGRDASVNNISQKDGIKDEVSGKLHDLSDYSVKLADAANGADASHGGLSVINVVSTTGKLSTDLEAANFLEPQNGKGINDLISSDGYLLINIDVSNYSTYTLDQIMSMDSETNKVWGADGDNEELARHIILNFVNKSGDNYSAFNGNITVDNVTAGTILAPSATVTQAGGIRGIVIADTFDRSDGAETHKDSLVDQRNAKVYVNNSAQESTGTEATISVKKSFNKWGKSNGFTFNIEAAGMTELDGETAKAGTQPMPSATTVTATSSDKVSFGSIAFSSTGLYTYKVTEALPADATAENNYTVDGITYDPSVHYVTVKVTENGKGALSAEVAYAAETDQSAKAASFTNTYNTKGTFASLVAHKYFKQPGFLGLLDADKELKGGEFTFELIGSDNKLIQTVANDAKGDVTFTPISYTMAGTYTYTIKEAIPDDAHKIPGVTYDETVYTVTVTVADDGSGQLMATVAYAANGNNADKANFTNRYETTQTTASIEVTKSFGSWDTAKVESFGFTLTPGPAVAVDGKTSIDNPLTEAVTKTVTKDSADAKAVFDSITYKQAGTYTYYITENLPEGGTYSADKATYVKDGITYDATKHKVVVTVTDNDSQLSANVKYDVADADAGTDALTITNTYAADETSASLEAAKELTGKTLKDGKFSFALYEKAADGTLAKIGDDAVNAADGKIAFGAIEYTAAGEHNYVIKEVVPADATPNGDGTYTKDGITYDTAEHAATVTVTDNGAGKLEAAVSYEGDKAPTFTNAYDASGSVTLGATKATTNGLSKAGYSFQVKDANGKVVSTGSSNDKGEVSFTSISYTLDDAGKTFDYTVSELVPAGATADNGYTVDGVTYDTDVYNVSVKVIDNGDGTLATEVTYKDGKAPTFTNEYNVEGETGLEATKYMDGRAFHSGDSYSFTVTPKGSAPAFSNATVTIKPTEGISAKVNFGTAKFTAAGTYTYTISETSTSANGVTVDNDPVTVTITATDDGKGGLTFAKSYTKDGNKVDAASFTNTYKAIGDAKAQLKATKSIAEGSAWESGDTFDIQLKDANGVIETKTATKSNPTVSFSTLSYDADTLAADVASGKAVKATDTDGKITYTYSYTIAEDTSKLPEGVAAVVSTQNAKVVVTEDTATGKLSAKTYIESDGEMVEGNEAGLVNQYATTEASAQLTATKTLSGRTLAAGEFSFQLKDADGNVIQTKANAADGSVTFDAIDYDAEGEYSYTIVEAAGNAGGVTYDSAEHTATVTVTKQGNALVASVSYDAPDAAPVFSNSYKAFGSVNLTATKATTNGLSKEGFTFEVKDADGKVVSHGTSDADGNVAFDAINYETDATGAATQDFTYTVYEVGGNAAGVTYSNAVYTVVVTVVDNGDGTLTATPAYRSADGTVVSGATFTNTYDASGDVTISGTKALVDSEGNAVAFGDRSFSFTLAGEGVEKTATTDANGNFSFDAITYGYSQIGDHTYTVTETAGNLGGVTYSTDSYQVTVTVEDNGNGTLDAQVTKVTKNGEEVEGMAIAFTNTYHASTAISLEGSKTYANGTLSDNQFGFTVYQKGGLGQDDTPVATGTVSAEGAISFDKELSYKTSDAGKTFDYVVKENIPEGAQETDDGYFDAKSGITYDGKEYSFSVKVADNGNGELSAEVVNATEGVVYDKGNLVISGLSFANSHFAAEGEFSFDKHYYGKNGSFDFTAQISDENGNALTGDALASSLERQSVAEEGKSFDENGAITATVSSFEKRVGTVAFDKIAYSQAGDYYYVVSENIPEESNGISMDETKYLVKVSVAEDATVAKYVKVLGEDADFEEMSADNSTFYNNRIVTMSFMSYAMAGDTADEHKTVVDPKVTKKLLSAEGTDAALEAGQFKFQLVSADGEVVQQKTDDGYVNYATNADDGVVDFDELTFTEAGTYTYTIHEVTDDASASITYDTTEYTMTVVVSEGDDGELESTVSYSANGVTYTADQGATFTNTFKGMNVRVQKVSREGGEGLVDCTYALWMVTPEGDVKIGSATSDSDGYITFRDVNMIKGVKYYFKEEVAPEGHTVDPYRTKYFTLNDEGTKLVSAEKSADDGWHAAGYKDAE